jgi:hypothetical protein
VPSVGLCLSDKVEADTFAPAVDEFAGYRPGCQADRSLDKLAAAEGSRLKVPARSTTQRCTKVQRTEYPVSQCLLTAGELIDLDGSDPGLEVGVYADHASTSRSIAQEADDLDDVAFLGKLVTAVLVELVDHIRVLQGEPNAVVAPRFRHNSTMAGWWRPIPFASSSTRKLCG